MPSKRTLLIVVPVVILPPAAGLALATTIGWLRFEWSLGGVLLVLGAYAGWIAILAGLVEFTGFFRHIVPPTPQSVEPEQTPMQTDLPTITEDPHDARSSPQSPIAPEHRAHLEGSGAIAQDHGAAAGAGGTAVGGSVHGGIRVSGRDKEKANE
jgi:hypothetical protein